MNHRHQRKTSNDILFPWLLVFYEVAVYLSMDAYAPGLPKIAQTFTVSPNIAQLTMIMWMIGGFSLQVIFGPLSDRYGRRPILLSGGTLYIISTLACAMAPNIHILLVARFFQGIALPSMFVPGYAAINEMFDSETAIKLLARMNAITILAPAFGPILGGAFLLAFSWRWIFAILAIWSFIAVGLLFFKMPETAPLETKQKPLNLIEILSHYKSVIKNTKFMAFSLMTFVPIIGLITWMLAGPFIITHVFHYNTFDYGVIQLIIFACFIIGTKMVAKFANNERNRHLINLGLGLCVFGGMLLTLVSWISPNALFIFILFLMIVMLGCGFSMPILNRLTLETSNAPMGIKVTMFSVVRISSGVIGSLCVATFYNGTLLSIAAIILFFTTAALLLRVFYQHP